VPFLSERAKMRFRILQTEPEDAARATPKASPADIEAAPPGPEPPEAEEAAMPDVRK